jgi:CRISPR system Cascade subunit CasA
MKGGAMNVAFDQWIPVVTTSGKPDKASLCSILTEGEKYADLAVRPHERVALMRLFLCVSHAALDGPKNYGEWCEVPKRLPEGALTYLKTWKDSFELFHETKPWLQVAGIQPAKAGDEKSFTPLEKLDFSLASTLFDHQGLGKPDRRFDHSQLILGLISMQNFSTCGLLSRPLWNGKPTPDSAKDAPCVTSSMYHVFLVGKNMSETICTNICDFKELKMLIGDSLKENWLGRPVWEQMPKDEFDNESTETFLGRLTPLSRAIRFIEGSPKMLYGEALRYATYPDFPQEFHTSVAIKKSKKKEERFLVGARLDVRPWRQLDAILQYNLIGKAPTHALCLSHLEREHIDIWVGALLRNPGKQDILDTVESRFSISEKLRTSEGCATYSGEVVTAQNLSKKLDTAVYLYRLELDPRNQTHIGSSAVNIYWTSVERNLPLLMAHVEALGSDDFESTGEAWRKMLFKSALEAYRIACGQDTPRQIKAFAKGWERLTSTKAESESDNQEIKEESA